MFNEDYHPLVPSFSEDFLSAFHVSVPSSQNSESNRQILQVLKNLDASGCGKDHKRKL